MVPAVGNSNVFKYLLNLYCSMVGSKPCRVMYWTGNIHQPQDIVMGRGFGMY